MKSRAKSTVAGVQVIQENQPASSTVNGGELWLHAPELQAQLKRVVAWSLDNPAQKTDLDSFKRFLRAFH